MSPPTAFRKRLRLQNSALFHWSADDGDVLSSRSGQAGTYSRASGDTVVTGSAGAGPINVGYGQPRWLETAYGASLLLTPGNGGAIAADTLTFPCNFTLGPMSIYVAGYLKQGGSGVTTTRVFRLGDGTANTLDILSVLPSNNTTVQYTDGVGNPSTTLSTGNPANGDYVEYLLQIDSTMKLTLTRTVNFGTPQVSALSAAGAAFVGGYHGAILKIADGANATTFAYRHVLVMADS